MKASQRKWRAICIALVAGGVGTCVAAEPGAWTTSSVAAAAGAKPRILLIHDMEGLAGQDDPYSFFYRHPSYPQARELLVADVNAVIDGLFAGGAGSVAVVDGHGSGNPDPDIPAGRLDSRARMLSRPHPFDPYVDLAEEERQFDAVAMVGMHAKSGSGGFASHTYTIGTQIFFEGHPVTETELAGLLYGRQGIPVIFVSGDDRLREDLKTMPWLQYVTTKKATSASTAELYPVDEVRAEMRLRARLAVSRLADARVMRAHSPLRVAVRAVSPASMAWLKGMPGVAYDNETVTFTAEDIVSAYRGITPIVTALNFSFADALRSPFEALPDAEKLGAQGIEELFRRWFAAESGEARPPDASPRQIPGKEYFGSE